jgi:uncharacterized membrane protein
MNDFDGAMGLILILFISLVGFLLQLLIAYFLYDGINKIPKKYRIVEPYFAWLTLIPLVGIVFYWILLPFKIPESFRYFFYQNPVQNELPKDFGKSLGLGAVISITLLIFPIINALALIASIVFMILYFIQFRKIVSHLPIIKEKNETNYPDKYDQLAKLKQLYDEGAITEDEFKKEKINLL